MGLMQQPTSFFSGGFRIKGDVELTGDIVQDPIKIGEGAETLENTIGIGRNATATGGGSTSVGIESDALAQHATAYGKNAQALAQDTTAIGNETTAPANWNTVVGYDAGSFQNGENIVLIGRKSEGQGDDSVAIGENARANGLQSSAIGKATSALAKNSSAFGQAATVTGEAATVVGQGVTLNKKDATSVGTGTSVTAEGATGIGRGSIATAQDSTAVGKNAEVNGKNSVAVGTGVVVNQDNTFSFGDRNINVPPGRSILYPNNSGVSTLVNFGITSDATAGSTQSYSLEINSESLFTVASDADGTGGIENKRTQLNGNITADSTTIWNSSQSHIPISSFEFTDIQISGSDGLSGGTVTLGGSLSISIAGTLSLDSDLQAVDGETIWSETNTHIPQSALENDSLTVSAGSNLNGGGAISLGGSKTLSLDDNITISVLNSDEIQDGGQGFIDFNISDVKVANMDSDGNLSIKGDLTEGAAL